MMMANLPQIPAPPAPVSTDLIPALNDLNTRIYYLTQLTENSIKQNLVQVKIREFNMPFFDLVGFMIKAAIASIPAAIILGLIGGGVFAAIAAIGLFGTRAIR